MRPLWLAVASLVVASGCSTYRDDLARSQHAFEENRHEEALAILRLLGPDTAHLSLDERARYAYLRGMTDFRIGYRADARHWLALARAMDEQNPGLIPSEWRVRLNVSLAELDALVWAGGMESLSSAKGTAVRPRRVPRSEPEGETGDDQDAGKSPKVSPKKNADDEDE